MVPTVSRLGCTRDKKYNFRDPDGSHLYRLNRANESHKLKFEFFFITTLKAKARKTTLIYKANQFEF
jgi:hypothetical protein